MTKSKITLLALIANISLVTVFCGCGDSSTAPKPQPAEGGTTQAVSAATGAVLPTGAVAVAGKPASEDGKSKKPVEPAVCGISMDGLEKISVKVSDTPDVTDFLNHVEIVPNPGPLTTDYYNWNQTVTVKADFQPRTKYCVTVKAGLPLADGRVTTNEVRRTFTTGVIAPGAVYLQAMQEMKALISR